MPRGKTAATKAKELINAVVPVATAIEVAKDIAKQKAELKKPIEVSIREHIGKIVDRTDVAQLVAIIGFTYIIHQGIDWVAMTTSEWQQAINIFGGLLPKEVSSVTQYLAENQGWDWVVSYAIAYMVVVHGMDISGGLIDFAKGVLAVA